MSDLKKWLFIMVVFLLCLVGVPLIFIGVEYLLVTEDYEQLLRAGKAGAMLVVGGWVIFFAVTMASVLSDEE